MDLQNELGELQTLTTDQLRKRYVELHDEQPRSRHKHYLLRRIAWRIQANAEGGLSERARRRAEELADVADIRTTPPRDMPLPQNGKPSPRRKKAVTTDHRLPPIGSAIVKKYKGEKLEVIVQDDGFEYQGERYKSLSAVAKAITGSHCNGYRFFRLGGEA